MTFENIDDFCDWVYKTCLVYGAKKTTAFKVAAEFAKDYERQQNIKKPFGCNR